MDTLVQPGGQQSPSRTYLLCQQTTMDSHCLYRAFKKVERSANRTTKTRSCKTNHFNLTRPLATHKEAEFSFCGELSRLCLVIANSPPNWWPQDTKATCEKKWTVLASGRYASQSENRSSRPQVSVKRCSHGFEHVPAASVCPLT